MVGIELAVCIHSHFLVYPYLCDSGLLLLYVLLLSFSHFGNGCAKERIKCEAAAGNPKFFVEPSCQEKLVNYFFRQFCDGTLVCSKVTLNIFLGVQIAECVENTTHT